MGRYVLTGGATGIGLAIKQKLVEQGHELIVVDVKNADVVADLSSLEGRQKAIEQVFSQAKDGLDGFIACAGVGGNTTNTPLIAQVNYFGAVQLADAFVDLVSLKKGSMVLISSNSAPMAEDMPLMEAMLDGNEGTAIGLAKNISAHGVYSASKQALARWMRRMTPAFAAKGVRINAVAPGYTQTPMTEAVENDPQYRDAILEFLKSIPVGHPGAPEDIAEPVLFLLSSKARYICGSVIFVDGGHDAMLRPEQI